MSTATFKGYKDGTLSGGVATRYGDNRTYLELPVGVPVEVENDSLKAAKALAEEKGENGELVYDIEIDTKPSASSASGSTEGAVS